MINDSLSDMLTRIRNANLVKNPTVLIPLTKLNKQIALLLQKEGFIHSISTTNEGVEDFLILTLKYKGREQQPSITNLKRISKPGLRVYVNSKNVPRLLNGLGIVLISTSQGLMTDREARSKEIGGEVICSIW